MVVSNEFSATDGDVDGSSIPDSQSAMTKPALQFFGVCVLGLLSAQVLYWMLSSDVSKTAILAGVGVYASVAVIAGSALIRHYPHSAIGWCNTVTVFRLMLTSVLIMWLLAPVPDSWLIFSVAVLALALDGLDGWLARKEGYVSDFGARFDMEVDSILALVLAIHAYLSGSVGVYVILLGLPRYFFWIAQFPMPWLNGDLPARFSRKVVCVLQISVLILVLLPATPMPIAVFAVGVTAVALMWSFCLDVQHLRQSKT